MKRPLFSVIVPTYNRAHLISKTLDSLLTQTCKDFEVLIVDNCSTDNTQIVISSYLSDHRFKFIRNQTNRERAYSRNIGMQNAQGEWITFLDSDDLLKPDCLEDAKKFAQKNHYKLFHNLSELRDSNDRLIYSYTYPSLKDSKKAIVEGNFLSCIGVFIKSDVAQKYSFDENPALTGTEDWDFFLRILAEIDLGRIPKVNSIIVEHNERTVHSASIVQSIYTKKMIVIEKVQNTPELSAVYGKWMNQMIASAHLYSGGLALQNKHLHMACVHLKTALVSSPRIIFKRRTLSLLLRLAIVALQHFTLRLLKRSGSMT